MAWLIWFPLLGNIPVSDVQFDTPKIILPSIDGIEYEAVRFTGIDLGHDSFSWNGKIQGTRSGSVSLAVVSGKSTITVSFNDGVTYSSKGKLKTPVFKQLIPVQKVCGGCVSSGVIPPDPRMRQQPLYAWQNGDANLIDLLVVYPSAVRTAAGGTSLIQAEIIKAVADTNLCYQNSRVNVQLRLVHMEEVSYTPTGLLNTDLNRLKSKNDGYIDNVHSIRDNYGADLVALLTTQSDSGGLASTLSHPSLNFESSGFSVNQWTQISAPSYTLAHEIGHNMGCLHNVEDSSGVTPLYDFGAFCYGKRWMNAGQGVKTVMSYDTQPSSTYPITIPYFSNPSVEYQGTLTGNSGSADNALVLSSTAPYVSNFRASVVQGIFPYSFNLEINEGNYSNLKVRLSAKPSSSISVLLSINGDSDFVLSGGGVLNFNSMNWNLPQTVQVYAKADTNSLSDTATLILSATGMPSVSVSLNEIDHSSNFNSDFLFSGVVMNELGIGLKAVSVTLSNGGGQIVTDEDGSFLHKLSANWSGQVSLVKDGYSFAPSILNLGPISSDSLGHSIVGSRSNVLYVNRSASGAGDGTSWGNAYTDLGDALRATTVYQEVWVAQGIYKPGLVRSSFFLIPPGLEVYGGFLGNEVSRDSRDVDAYPVILSGDLGILNNTTDNAFHVVVPSSGSVLDGFTITGGNASENFNNDDRGKGGGLWADDSNFTLSNCKFTNNLAYQGGAGIYLKEVNATFINCEFLSNQANSNGKGGAGYLKDSNVSFQNCKFNLNTAGFEGGALLWEDSVGSIFDSNFTDNSNSQSNGGGALFIENSSPVVKRCVFSQNITLANNYGGAIKLVNSSPIISESNFIRNRSPVNSAGAIYIDPNSIPVFSKNEFHFNSSAQFGGAIFVEGPTLEMNGTLFLGNYSNLGGGIATQGSVGVSFINTRALGNEANSSSSSNAGFIYLNSGTTSSIFVNCIFSGNKSQGRSGVFRSSGLSRFVNCSFTGNHSADLGGIVILFGGDIAQFDNCILWNNTATTAGNDVVVNSGMVSANYSIFNPTQSSGSISGTNNQNSDPLFKNAIGSDNIYGTIDDDLSLQSSGPAIDTASDSVTNYTTYDINGQNRSGSPDRGAYEYVMHPPPFEFNATALQVPEDAPIGRDVGSVYRVSGDLNQSVVFSLEQNGSSPIPFSVESNGTVLVAGPLDYEQNASYPIHIRGTEGNRTVVHHYVIQVLDVNESTGPGPQPVPPFEFNATALQVPEDAPIGRDVGSVYRVSGDLNQSVVYSLEQNGSLPIPFSVESNGTILVAGPLDYEQNASYPIHIRGTEGNRTVVHHYVIQVLDVNESTGPGPQPVPPFDFNATALQVPEDAPIGRDVGSVYRVSGDLNQSVVYSLEQNGSSPIPFSVESNGTILVGGLLDYEQNASYPIHIRGTEGNRTVVHHYVIQVLDVNESTGPGPQPVPPFDFNATALQVSEDAPIGRDVGSVYRVSGDLNQSVVYSLEQNGSSPIPFSVESNGTILVGGLLDYEQNASYPIHIRGTEGNRTVVHHYVIQVLDVNESTGPGPQPVPPFDFNATALQVSEDAPIGRDVGSVYRVSGDLNQSVVFSLEQNGSSPIPFSVESNGTILVGGLLDYEQNASYPIHIRGTEGNRTVVHHYVIQVLDVNESTGPGPQPVPPFDFNATALQVPEDAPIGRDVGSVYRVSGDLNQSVVFSLEQNGSLPIPFSVESNGTILVAGPLDYEQNASYPIHIRGTEGNRTVVHHYVIQVLDVNESTGPGPQPVPPFDFNATALQVPEDAPIGRDVGSVYRVSGDLNQSVVYSLEQNGSSPIPFSVESNGTILVGGPLDYEQNASYPIHIRGTEGNRTVVHHYVIQVLDVNESTGPGPQPVPPFEFNATALQVPEDAPIGRDVGSVYRVSGDLNQSVVYSLEQNGSSPIPFSVESNGTILVGGLLDYEQNASYPIHIRGTEGNRTLVHHYVIQVLDVNESTGPGPQPVPPFDFNATALQVPEDAPIGRDVGSVYRVSGDLNQSVVFSLEQNGSSPIPFSVESNGTILVAGPLDYEQNASYPIHIRGTEGNRTVVHHYVIQVLDVNESTGPGPQPVPPFDFNATALQVSEDAPIGRAVGSVYRVSGDLNQSVVYSLEQNGSLPIPFSVESNGTILVGGLLDYEQNASYPIHIRGTEGNRTVVHHYVIQVLDVNESTGPGPQPVPPFDFNATALQVPEDAPIGRDVGSVYRVSGDLNQSVVYSLEQNGSSPIPFSVESNGTILVGGLLDYEQNASYPIHIRGTEGNRTLVHHYVIQVLDVNESTGPGPQPVPPFDFNATALQVPEDAPIGRDVGSVYRVSGDLNQSVVFSLEQNGSSPIPFSVESNGTILVGGLLDYEQNASYPIHIRGTEGNRTLVHHYVIQVLDVNESTGPGPQPVPPFDFNATALQVSEDAPIGRDVGSVYRVSGDLNQSVVYSLEQNGSLPIPFSVESNGTILVGGPLDYEQNASYPIHIRGTEGNRTVVHHYVIQVLDVNESTGPGPQPVPPFDFNATALQVPENAPIGRDVGSVYRVSGDLNQSVVYSLEQNGSLPIPFSVESNGTILVGGLLDYEQNASYPIHIRGTEGNRTLVHHYVIQVLDVNESTGPGPQPVPPFDFNATALQVSEDAPIGRAVGSVYRVSGDLNQSVVYSLEQNGSLPIPFSVESNGTILVGGPLDYEQNASYPIHIRGTEGNRTVVHHYVIQVLDVNESTGPGPQPVPPFDFNATALQVSEDAPIGRAVGSVYRVSGDLNQSVVYSLEQNGSLPIPFSVESNGTVLVAGPLDYEQNASYPIHIRGTEGNRTVVRGFEIKILDVFEIDINSAPTDISILSDKLQIKGNQDAGTMVGDFYAVDSDQDDAHTFILVDGARAFDNSLFVMESNGTLRTSSVLDFGMDQNLSIRVQVSDSKGATYQKTFDVLYIHQQAGEDVILLSDGADVVPGWKRVGWFGFYFADFYPWVYHENLGWIFVSEKTDNGAWFFRDRLGWVWTSPEVFPALFQFEQNQWTYLDTSNPWTILFDYVRMEWFELDRDYEVFGLSQPASGGYVKGFGIYQRGQVTTLEAVPSSGYIFKGWEGDMTETEPVLILEVYNDLKIEALFDPIISPDKSPQEAVGSAVEAINSIEGLSPELKQKALAELLLTGASSTAGIKATGE